MVSAALEVYLVRGISITSRGAVSICSTYSLLYKLVKFRWGLSVAEVYLPGKLIDGNAYDVLSVSKQFDQAFVLCMSNLVEA